MKKESNYSKTLEQTGLHNDEIAIYTLLIEHGPQTAGIIAKKTALKPGNTYNKINDLIEKNLVEEVKNGKQTLFQAAHPSALRGFVESKKEALEQAERGINAILPAMLSDYNLSNDRPGMAFFEGKEGIIKLYEELLEDKLPIDSIEDKGEMADFIPDYFPQFIKKRCRYKLYNRVIAPSNNMINVTSKKEMRETRHVDVKKFPFEMDIKINDRRVTLVTFKSGSAIGVSIMDPEIAKNFKLLFEFWWGLSDQS